MTTTSVRARATSEDGTPPGVPGEALVVATGGRPHGLRGELRLVPTSGQPERLAGLTEVWTVARHDEEPVRRRILALRVAAGSAVARLEGVDDRDAAAALTNGEVWGRASELPSWGEDGFGLADVVGATLFDGEREVGEVVDLVTNAGRDYFEVSCDERRVLVPAVKDWLVELSLSERRIVMRLPEGLIE